MNPTLQSLLQAATRLTQSGQLKEATEAIQRALNGSAPRPAPAAKAAADVLDGCVFEVDAKRADAHAEAPWAKEVPPVGRQADQPDGSERPQARVWQPAGTPAPAQTSHAKARTHTLYTPPGADGQQLLPLVVMLHGCTQDAADFAAGTGMSERARERGFYVLYPVQSQAANPQRCWNWFKHNHQQRGHGEPAWIADLTREVIARHGIDPRRVYIAGLSAGGAMATIVADAYPDIFAAVGVHSGLPRGVVHNAPQALALMNTGVAGSHGNGAGLGGGLGGGLGIDLDAGLQSMLHPASRSPAPTVSHAGVPTIVFHGDQDQTVHPRNGEQVLAAWVTGAEGAGQAAGGSSEAAPNPPVRRVIERGVSPHGRRYTRSTYHGAADATVAEHWLIHGAGHAWAGGHAAGSYTDPSGPDASLEMLRFFLEHPRTSAD